MFTESEENIYKVFRGYSLDLTPPQKNVYVLPTYLAFYTFYTLTFAAFSSVATSLSL